MEEPDWFFGWSFIGENNRYKATAIAVYKSVFRKKDWIVLIFAAYKCRR